MLAFLYLNNLRVLIISPLVRLVSETGEQTFEYLLY